MPATYRAIAIRTSALPLGTLLDDLLDGSPTRLEPDKDFEDLLDGSPTRLNSMSALLLLDDFDPPERLEPLLDDFDPPERLEPDEDFEDLPTRLNSMTASCIAAISWGRHGAIRSCEIYADVP